MVEGTEDRTAEDETGITTTVKTVEAVGVEVVDAAGVEEEAVVATTGINVEVTGVTTAGVRTKTSLEEDLAAEVSKTATITIIVAVAMVDQVAQEADLLPLPVVRRRRLQHSRSRPRRLQ